MSSPYDSKLHNTYRLAFESGDIRQFHITLTITGRPQDQISAKVWERYNKKDVVLANTDAKVKPGSSFTLKGSLPKPLKVERHANGCEFRFSYAQPSDGAKWFQFDTRNDGFGLAKFKNKKGKPDAKDKEKYCDQSTLPGKNGGTVFECSFPGW